MIDGVVAREVATHEDERGWLAELFRVDELPEGLAPRMAYVSSTDPGVTRGPHEHREQTDIFCFIGVSEFKVYLWDNREGSPSFGKRDVINAPSGSPLFVIIPPGVVHAYKNTGSSAGLVINAPNRLFRGEGRKGKVDEIRYEDRPEAGFTVD
jgi:dTDP-4-dehydrorhamnose 3,5-epimerase